MRMSKMLLLLLTKVAIAQHGANYADTMGPVAFMWPPDRVWGAAQDNTSPCGSMAGVVNRTNFPLLNGQVALVAQNESWLIQIAISHNSNPTRNEDFDILIEGVRIPELDQGHQCYPIANPSADIESGSNATLQIKYTSDFENDGVTETYYACADIIYVPISQFTYQVPCFNATIDDFNVTDSTDSSASSVSNAVTSASSAQFATGVHSNGLSKGAIVGTVIGTLLGLALILGAVFLAWRRSQQLKRIKAQEASVRNVKWVQSAASQSTSGNNVILKDLR